MRAANVAHDMNVLAAFLGRRDVAELSQDALEARFGFARADVMALVGGSILAGGDVMAQAMRAGVAHAYAIVGGVGHTTQDFREKVRELCPDLRFADDACEADVFAAYLRSHHGLEVDLLERRSTNCGNNITFLRDLLAERGMRCRSLILVHDASMQLRVEAVARKELPDVVPVSYACHAARVVAAKGAAGDPLAQLRYEDEPWGMWAPGHYLSLLMGEIPRLRDDAAGYGPNGRDYLVHVDIPDDVLAAFARLSEAFPESVRVARRPEAGVGPLRRH